MSYNLQKHSFYLKVILILSFLFITQLALAKPVAKIAIIKKDKAIILVKKGLKIRKGSEYQIRGKKSNATVKVLRVKGSKVFVQFYDGKLFKNDYVGIKKPVAKIEEEMDFEDDFDEEPVAEEKPEQRPKVKVDTTGFKSYITASFDFTNSASFAGSKSSALPNSFDTDVEFENGIGIGYEYRKSAPYSWGLGFGGSYHLDRSVSAFAVDGTKVTASGDAAKISFIKAYANGIYRWDSFYIPFGLNYTRVSYTAPSSFDGTVASNGGIGLNFGLGFVLTTDVRLELASSTNFWDLSTLSGSTRTDYGTGVLSVGSIRVLKQIGN